MVVKRIWMSTDTRRKSRYGLRTLGGILGIAVLALVLVAGGTVLGLFMGWPMELVSLALCGAVTALTTVLAVNLGRRSLGDATIFFLTEDDRLFLLDARHLADYGGSAISHAAGILKTQQSLRKLARSSELEAGADQILRVVGIREHRAHYAMICQVRRSNQRVVRRACFLVKGMEDQELLLRQLERREGCAELPEEEEDRKPFYLLCCILVCLGFSALCVLSHPAMSRLPQYIYFPCLAAAFAALCCAVWFGVRLHRGE